LALFGRREPAERPCWRRPKTSTAAGVAQLFKWAIANQLFDGRNPTDGIKRPRNEAGNVDNICLGLELAHPTALEKTADKSWSDRCCAATKCSALREFPEWSFRRNTPRRASDT
jgi:hypothetical protein